jgi:outer membrane protein assembly factor BamB
VQDGHAGTRMLFMFMPFAAPSRSADERRPLESRRLGDRAMVVRPFHAGALPVSPSETRLRKLVAGSSVLAIAAAAAFESGSTAAVVARAPRAAQSVDWDTYGVNSQRTGFNRAENQLDPSAVNSIRNLWHTKLGAPIITQPVVASGVVLEHPRRVVNLVYAATEHGRVAAMDADTGRVVWSRRLKYQKSFCGELPNNDYGISGTPVIDRARHSIYTMGGYGRLFELDLGTGHTKRRWTLTSDPLHQYDYGALTLTHGMLYVPFAGPCDQKPYYGFVAAIRVRDGKRIGNWFPSGAVGGGGVWGFGGVSADPSGGIFAAVGNASDPSEHAGYGEHVVRLTPDLHVVSANYPGLPRGDADFGATPVLFQRPGCPPQLAVGNKYGSFFLYDRDRIASGPVQRIELGGSGYGQAGLIGVAAYWPTTATIFVTNPLDRGQYRRGIVAFHLTDVCRLSYTWSMAYGPQVLDSSPTVADGVVYFGLSSGYQAHLAGLDARTGHLLWTSGGAIKTPVFAPPTVVNGKVYLSSAGGYLSAFGHRSR